MPIVNNTGDPITVQSSEVWALAEKLYAAHCVFHGHGDGSRWADEPFSSRTSWCNIARTALQTQPNREVAAMELAMFSELIKRGIDQDTADQVSQAVAAALSPKEPGQP